MAGREPPCGCWKHPGPPQALLPAEPSLQHTHGIFSGLSLELAVIFFFWHEAHARQCALAKTNRKDLILFIKCCWFCKWRKGVMFSIEKPHIWINLDVLTEKFSKNVVLFLLNCWERWWAEERCECRFFFKGEHFGSWKITLTSLQKVCVCFYPDVRVCWGG